MFSIVFYCRQPTVGEYRVDNTYTFGLYIYCRGTCDSRARRRAARKKNAESSRIVCFCFFQGQRYVLAGEGEGGEPQSIKTGSVRLNRDDSWTIDFLLWIRAADVSVLRFFPNNNLPNVIKNVFP